MPASINSIAGSHANDGKAMVACSDAHSLAMIGKNASTVVADELSAESIFAGIRAGRVSFHRRSMELGPLIVETSKAIGSQPRHIGSWARAKWAKRRSSASPSRAHGFDPLP